MDAESQKEAEKFGIKRRPTGSLKKPTKAKTSKKTILPPKSIESYSQVLKNLQYRSKTPLAAVDTKKLAYIGKKHFKATFHPSNQRRHLQGRIQKELSRKQ